MISMIFICWTLLLGSIPQVLSFGLPDIKVSEKLPQISVSESNYVLMYYGHRLESKKLNKRERLALALTNWLDDGQ